MGLAKDSGLIATFLLYVHSFRNRTILVFSVVAKTHDRKHVYAHNSVSDHCSCFGIDENIHFTVFIILAMIVLFGMDKKTHFTMFVPLATTVSL